ncbi:hypothetical protein [Sphingomonas sp. DC2300-3]|uniref:hypothetical protein n=1 Tax=unclassified Sphingomonas TaxID=196159 RepID=UPI003CF70DB9
MTDKTPLQRLDALVGWTGIPALSQHPPRRRPLRWPATIALALAFAGIALSLSRGMQTPLALAGYGIEMLGFALAMVVKIVGPLKPYGGTEKTDEWDRAVRARAYLWTFAVFAITTMLALFALMAGLALDWPKPALMQGAAQTLFLLFTILNATPAAQASWAVRWQQDDDQAG